MTSEPHMTLRAPGRHARLTVLYRSNSAVALLKIAGLPTIPGRGYDDCLHAQVQDALPSEDVCLVHRLDEGTSGVILFAFGQDAQRALQKQFKDRSVEKTYLALVRGRPTDDRGEIEIAIGPDTKHPERMSIHSKHPKAATTQWECVERFGDFALLRCRPVTGRTHQIRVHLRASAMPLAVDAAYGGDPDILLSRLKPDYKASRRRPERPLIDRPTLHAESIVFVDPADGETKRVEAALPKDFRATLNQLRKLFGVPTDAGL